MLKTKSYLASAAIAVAPVLAATFPASLHAAEEQDIAGSSATVFEHEGFSLGARVSTLGVGGELGYRPNDWLGVRGFVNYFTFSTDERFNDLNFDIDLDLLTGGGALDLYLFGSGFRMTGGAFYNANKADLVVAPAPGTTITISGETFRSEDVGRVDGRIDFRDFAPYAGFGYDGRLFNSVYFTFDGGVMFQGSPRVGVSARGIDPRIREQFEEALERERRQIVDDVDSFKFYPVVSVGLRYVF